MTPEAQRIAIAKACGWTEVRLYVGGVIGVAPTGVKYKTVHAETLCAWCPDYLTDLNAMHEAEKICLLGNGVDYSRWERYDNYLFELCGGFARAHATSAQRAEAFLKTINLWTDTK